MDRKAFKKIFAWFALAAIIGSMVMAGVAHASDDIGAAFEPNDAFKTAFASHEDSYYLGAVIEEFSEPGSMSLSILTECFSNRANTCASDEFCAIVGKKGIFGNARGGCVPESVYCEMQEVKESRAPQSRTINGAKAPSCSPITNPDIGRAFEPNKAFRAAYAEHANDYFSGSYLEDFSEEGNTFLGLVSECYKNQATSCLSGEYCAIVGALDFNFARGGCVPEEVYCSMQASEIEKAPLSKAINGAAAPDCGFNKADTSAKSFTPNDAFIWATKKVSDYDAFSFSDFQTGDLAAMRAIPQCTSGNKESCANGTYCAVVGGQAVTNFQRGGCVSQPFYCAMQRSKESKAPKDKTINRVDAPSCDTCGFLDEEVGPNDICVNISTLNALPQYEASQFGTSDTVTVKAQDQFTALITDNFPYCGFRDECSQGEEGATELKCAALGAGRDSDGNIHHEKRCLPDYIYNSLPQASLSSPSLQNPMAYRLDPTDQAKVEAADPQEKKEVAATHNTPQGSAPENAAVQQVSIPQLGTGINLSASGLTAPDPSQIRGIAVANNAQDLLTGILNFFLSFVAIVAVGVLVYGGFMYITSGIVDGNADKGKKAVTGAVTGIILIISSWTIVNTVINLDGGRFSGGGAERVRGGEVLLTYNFKDNRGGSITLVEGVERAIPEFTNGRALLQGQTVTIKCTVDATKINTRHLTINENTDMSCTYNTWDKTNVQFRFTNL